MVCLGKKVNCLCYLCREDNAMTAQPAPKTQELANKIFSFYLKRRKLGEFDIPRLEKDVENLKGKIEYAKYYDFLGQIASLRRDKDNIISYYENALKLASNDSDIQYNYMVGLGNSGFITQAIEQGKVLVGKFPDKPEALTPIIDHISYLCRFKSSLPFLNKLENPTEFHNYKIIQKAISIFADAQLSDDEAQHLCQFAFSVLETKNLYYSDSEIKIADDCVCYTIYVDSPIEDMFDINWELAGIFAEKVEDMRSDVLMFEYSSIDVLEEKEKYERSI
jgi:tetratricopeptide (TPR) repeat protein